MQTMISVQHLQQLIAVITATYHKLNKNKATISHINTLAYSKMTHDSFASLGHIILSFQWDYHTRRFLATAP